jgi:uncharacterized protein (DUF1330 family)
MPAYRIVETKVRDPEIYSEYGAKAPDIAAKFGRGYPARSNRAESLFGGWTPERMVILEFPSEENLRRRHDSAEYRAIAPFRETGAETRAVILDGSVD